MSTDEPIYEPTYEYAIELPGQGWLHGLTPGSYLAYMLSAEPVILAGNTTDALEALSRARNFYGRIGAASVGDQLRLVQRSVTLVHSDWIEITA